MEHLDRVAIVHGNASALPLPDESVDLVITSPPYYALRSYQDGGEAWDGQIGIEASPWAYLDNLLTATREWVRVLKPEGSIFVNLGDKYSAQGGAHAGHGRNIGSHRRGDDRAAAQSTLRRDADRWGIPAKSLMLLPERYRIACVDQLGLIARAVIIWDKPNTLPESVGDRVRRQHEDWVHLVKQPRYYQAVDDIREPTTRDGLTWEERPVMAPHPLGKIPGSVWRIPTKPLIVPKWLGVDHFASFPVEWPKRLILGWSPPGICVECGQGRFPVTVRGPEYAAWRAQVGDYNKRNRRPGAGYDHIVGKSRVIQYSGVADYRHAGYACACTPYTDHEGDPVPERTDDRPTGLAPRSFRGHLSDAPVVGSWREYHFDRWTPAPMRPAVVLDPMGGSGTTALAAAVLGRFGISVDGSHDYGRLARWRVSDPAQVADAMGVDRPPPVPRQQRSLFDSVGVV